MTKRFFSSVRLALTVISLIIFSFCSTLASDETLEEKLDQAFEEGQLSGLHSVYVLYKGEVLAERYYTGKDQRWGTSIGIVTQNAEQLHDLRSVTKSITSLLYGIALDEGIVTDLDGVLMDQYPEYQDLAADPVRRKILIKDVLTMQMGIEWDENLPYSDPRNSEIGMENAKDRYRFVLERPVIGVPGERWVYNGGATALIAHLIEKGAGKSIDLYAKEKLFDPLGIEEFDWVKGRDGAPSAASGLRLTTHGLSRIGEMLVNQGKWDGNQIVSAEWIEASFTARTSLPMGLKYGYFWWLAPEGIPPYWAAGFGNGGQRLVVDERNQLVVIIFAGNYNQPGAWQLPVKVITEFVLPSVRSR